MLPAWIILLLLVAEQVLAAPLVKGMAEVEALAVSELEQHSLWLAANLIQSLLVQVARLFSVMMVEMEVILFFQQLLLMAAVAVVADRFQSLGKMEVLVVEVVELVLGGLEAMGTLP